MRKFFEIGGLVAAAVLLVFGVGALVMTAPPERQTERPVADLATPGIA
jgi:hypothetical protein